MKKIVFNEMIIVLCMDTFRGLSSPMRLRRKFDSSASASENFKALYQKSHLFKSMIRYGANEILVGN